MPRRVSIPHRVVFRIRVPVQILRVGRIRHDGIGRDEPPQHRVIVPGVVVQQPGVVTILAGVVALGGADTAATRRAPGQEGLAARGCAGRDTDAAEVVTVSGVGGRDNAAGAIGHDERRMQRARGRSPTTMSRMIAPHVRRYHVINAS
jgi:hypothetical protein